MGNRRIENFLICNKFGRACLPDGQCGCGAFRNHKDASMALNLTSVGYGIEADFLIEILSNRLNFSLFPVEINPEDEGIARETKFDYTSHKEKMKFISEK